MNCRVLGVLLGILVGTAARANYPVFDASNFAKMTETVRLLQQQVTQLQATYRAVSGSRGLGDVLYNPALRNYLPQEWMGVYDAVAAGRYAGISGSMQGIDRAEQIAGSVAEQIARVRERERLNARVNKALGIQAFEGAKARLVQIERLMGQVNLTQDAKGAAEIQARIQVEQAAVANEATKLQLVSMLQQAEDRLAQQQRDAVGAKLMDPNAGGMPRCCSVR